MSLYIFYTSYFSHNGRGNFGPPPRGWLARLFTNNFLKRKSLNTYYTSTIDLKASYDNGCTGIRTRWRAFCTICIEATRKGLMSFRIVLFLFKEILFKEINIQLDYKKVFSNYLTLPSNFCKIDIGWIINTHNSRKLIPKW